MSPKEATRIDITEATFKDPLEVIKNLSANFNISYTKVIQTYVMEDRIIDLVLEKEGSAYFKGKIVWIGNRKDDTEGTIFCVQTDSDLKKINPTAENTEKVILDKKKAIVRISTEAKAKCSVCGKNIEIFDDVAGCPLCEAKAHKDHLFDWIKMKNSCPVCKKRLSLSSTGQIIID
ncbi:MAG: hypothetical protein GF317_15900 [Candidatus Lokiarchaeota archaeon]|nr:hypothetical protein [Candidatus Lokiarchaeota archaeon]MBD3201031.1 hypothetical protein [Candidatus Lokiarchaeota archaeon]